MSDYRDEFYANYASEHTEQLYGPASLGAIRKQFPVWEAYFGRLLPAAGNGRILDIGCGDGGFVYWLQERGFKSAEGIDVSAEQVARAGDMGIKGIHKSDIDGYLAAHPAGFSAIIARDVLEHFRKDELPGLMRKIAAALKPEGIFIAQTANAENLLWGRLRYGDFTHEAAFTRSGISQLLRLADLEGIHVYPQRPVVHGLSSFLRALAWWGVERALNLYLMIETGSPSGIFTQNLIVRAAKK